MLERAAATNTSIDLERNERGKDDMQVKALLNHESQDSSELAPANILLIQSRKSIERQDSKEVVSESRRCPEAVGLDAVEQITQVT